MKKAEQSSDIIVAGDGIAGRAFALALAQSGVKTTVIAPNTASKPAIGGGIQLAPNGWAALCQLGIENAASPHAKPLSLMRLIDMQKGYNLTQLALNDRPRRTPYQSITRQGLMGALKTALLQTKRITWRDGRIVNIASENNNAVLTLEDDTIIKCPWLIGADAADGVARRYVQASPKPIKPNPARLAYHIAIPANTMPPYLNGDAVSIWLGERGHIVYYPLADGTINAVATVSTTTDASTHFFRTITKHHQLQPLVPFFEAIDPRPIYHLIPLDAYQRGRVILTGDAAHPMPPHLAQGAGQALIDAAILRQKLTHLSAPIAEDNLRHSIVEWGGERAHAMRSIHDKAMRASTMFGLSGGLAKARNIALSTIGGPILKRQLEALWSIN